MKNILYTITLLVSISSFGQDKTVTINKSNSTLNNDYGLKYLGDGKYQAIQQGASYFVPSKKLEKKAIKKLEEFAKQTNTSFKILNSDKAVGRVYAMMVTAEFRNKDDGSLYISKDEAKKRLLELKEFLDLGILTQEEFDKKAKIFKNILLK